ncbi:MAG: ribosomal L7Ae/L30e/S12e/Gadd45 family protein [Eubacteriales bacterium]
MIKELESAQNKVIGSKQILKHLNAKSLKKVFIAADIDMALKDKLVFEANKAGIEVVMVASAQELGKICGIQVSCAAAGILI